MTCWFRLSKKRLQYFCFTHRCIFIHIDVLWTEYFEPQVSRIMPFPLFNIIKRERASSNFLRNPRFQRVKKQSISPKLEQFPLNFQSISPQFPINFLSISFQLRAISMDFDVLSLHDLRESWEIKFKEKTFTCLSQTSESFSLNLKFSENGSGHRPYAVLFVGTPHSGHPYMSFRASYLPFRASPICCPI